MEDLIKNYLNLSAAKQKLVETMLKEKGIEITDLIILPQHRNGKLFPASFAQRRLWFLEQFEPGSPLYIIPIAVKVKGELNKSILESAVNQIIERHEVLRTSFKEIDGNVVQFIHNDVEIKINEIDISNEAGIDDKLKEILQHQGTEPFDLTGVPLLRVSLVKIIDEEQVLLIPMHHIISDNWSTAVFVKELLEIYKSLHNKEKVKLEPLPIQYADYSVWQQERFRKNIYQEQTKYWVNKLTGSNDALDIITDFKRPPVQTFNGSFELFEIQSNILSKLNQLAKQTDTTLFMILISAFQVLLYHYTNQDDINIGTPIANRNRAEIEGLIGFFINTLVMRGNLFGNPTFKELLERTKEIALEAYQNQDVPFEDIVDKLNLKRDLSHTALFQAMFVLNNARMEKLELPGIEFEVLDIDTSTTKFDLVLSITENDNILKGKFEYNTDLFKSFSIKRLIKSFENILFSIVDNPEQNIDKIKIAEKNNLSVLYGDSIDSTDNIDVYNLIEIIAGKHKDKIALSSKHSKLTYSQLIDKTNILAEYLINKGVNPKDIVGVYLDRTTDYIISMLAIFKIGAVYLPLDVEYPEERLQYLIDDSSAKFILTENNHANQLKNFSDKIIDINGYETDRNGQEIKTKTESSETAYIIYTSGSTGNPKGVEVTHKALANHILTMQKHFNITENDKELEFAAFNFDASIEQILVPLVSGAELFVRGNDIWTAAEFTKIINEEKLTVINPPTVVWAEISKYWHEHPDKAPSNQLKLCIAGGDEMKADMIRMWMDSPMKSVRLLNAYGPTEGIITASTSEVNKLETENIFRTPIGIPLPGRDFYIVDKNMNIIPKGFVGELCIGSELLASGYLGKPEITNEKFIPNLFDKNKKGLIYRTGDLVRINENNEVEFIGRIDTQVKIRGFRIELGEIESVLRNHELLEEAAVTVHNGDEDKFIAAYFVVKDNSEIETAELIKYMKNKLPNYMIPAAFVKLENIPFTASGKIDKKSLPEPDLSLAKIKTEFVAPRTETEKEIAKIIANILSIEKVGVFDNFFELGGHSILAIKVVSEVKQNFGVDIELINLFQNPTVEGLAEAVVDAQSKLIDDDDLESLLDELESI